MTKNELIIIIADKTGEQQKTVSAIIDSMINVISESLIEHGEKVTLTGLGTFETRSRAERNVRNPRTNEVMHIPAQKSIGFKVSKFLKNSIK